MSNRKKPKRSIFARAKGKLVDLPKPEEKEVVRVIPAILHWGDVPGSPRTDDETIGQAVIYADGEQDVLIFDDISDDAKLMISGAEAGVDHFSIVNEPGTDN